MRISLSLSKPFWGRYIYFFSSINKIIIGGQVFWLSFVNSTKRFYVQMCKCVSWWILFTFPPSYFPSSDIHISSILTLNGIWGNAQHTQDEWELGNFVIFSLFFSLQSWKLYDQESRYFWLDLWHWPSQIEFLIAKACSDVSRWKDYNAKLKFSGFFFWKAALFHHNVCVYQQFHFRG